METSLWLPVTELEKTPFLLFYLFIFFTSHWEIKFFPRADIKTFVSTDRGMSEHIPGSDAFSFLFFFLSAYLRLLFCPYLYLFATIRILKRGSPNFLRRIKKKRISFVSKISSWAGKKKMWKTATLLSCFLLPLSPTPLHRVQEIGYKKTRLEGRGDTIRQQP